MVIWNTTNLRMLRYSERPHRMAVLMLANELSMMVMSLASLARAVPSPMESPTCAFFKAGASLVPSPVTATTSPRSCNSPTRRALSLGLARDRILNSALPTNVFASSSVRASNSAPVSATTGSPRSTSPACWAISPAVRALSPVTMITLTCAWFRQVLMASATSLLTGSAMATMACRASAPWCW